MMPAFAVLEPPGHADTVIGRADRFIFLQEKFGLSAFLFGPLWMMWQQLWLELLVYLPGLAAIGSGLYVLGVGWPAMILIFGLIHLLLGLEAMTLVREMRLRHGWHDCGIVIADDLDLAERRFFGDRVAGLAARTAVPGTTAGSPGFSAPLPPSSPHRGPHGPDVVGLFPEPGGGR
jgi:Protein of unknown function (DUF2628)